MRKPLHVGCAAFARAPAPRLRLTPELQAATQLGLSVDEYREALRLQVAPELYASAKRTLTEVHAEFHSDGTVTTYIPLF